jgi:hypothetical protein
VLAAEHCVGREPRIEGGRRSRCAARVRRAESLFGEAEGARDILQWEVQLARRVLGRCDGLLPALGASPHTARYGSFLNRALMLSASSARISISFSDFTIFSVVVLYSWKCGVWRCDSYAARLA